MKIGILLGDDIGREVVPECVKVMKAAASRSGLTIDWQPLPIGRAGHEEHGDTLPAVTEQALHKLDGWVLGPIGHATYPRNDPTWVMPPIRKKYELFAAARPSRSYANLKSIHKNVDIVFVRELTEGMLYSETVVAGAGGIPAERRHHRRHARDHAQRLQPRRARGVRDRAHPRRARRSPPRTRSRSTGWPAACSRKNAARWRRNIPTSPSKNR